MALQPGQRALDVGCGTGNSTLALASVVGSNGFVCGVDYDRTMIAEAQRRAVVDGLGTWVTYHQANAAALPWPDGYFDASRGDRVLQHITNLCV
jgi:ubiquinone/menaquinone biosynthesis C-methylase UbiE